MWRVGFVLTVVLETNGLDKATTMKNLTFLTRDGCVNTPGMVNNRSVFIVKKCRGKLGNGSNLRNRRS